jgi:hypothetical protein
LIEGKTLGDDDDTANGSKPSNVWCNRHKLTATSTGDQTTVNAVIREKVFLEIKFVDQESQLMFSNDKNSICRHVIRRCNLHSDISLRPNWWKHVQKFVSQAINWLRNDRNTAMKWARLGKILTTSIIDKRNALIVCAYFSDWLQTEDKVLTFRKKKITKSAFAIKDLVEGRKNEAAYTAFFDYFVPCATKKTLWDRRVAKAVTNFSSKKTQSLCTISDEAFALLLLENS